jgi:hypothetical protein
MSAEIVPGKGWNLTGRSHAAFHRLDHPNSALPWPQLFRADDFVLDYKIIRPEVKQIVKMIVNSHKTSIGIWRYQVGNGIASALAIFRRTIRYRAERPLGRNKLNVTRQQGFAPPETVCSPAYETG